MFEILALNPPRGAGRSKVRGGKRRSKSKPVVKPAAKAKAKAKGKSASKRSKAVPKHRMPPRIKSGPKKGQFRKRKSAHKNPTGKKFSGRVFRPKIKRRVGRRSWKRTSFGGVRRYLNPSRKSKAKKASRKRAAAKPTMAGYGGFFGGTLAGQAAAPKKKTYRKIKGAVYVYKNPKRRRKARRHANPKFRRKRTGPRSERARNPKRRRRHRNPGGALERVVSMGPSIRLPVLGQVAPLQMAFDGLGLAAGASAALLVPAKVASLVGKAWINQGWYGVALSGATSLGVAGVGRMASPRLAKLLGLGGAFATVLRALAQLAPAQTQKFVTGPLSEAGSGGLRQIANVQALQAMQAQQALAARAGSNGMGLMMTAGDIIRGEASSREGMRDWVNAGGMRDWVDMAARPGSVDNTAESF